MLKNYEADSEFHFDRVLLRNLRIMRAKSEADWTPKQTKSPLSN